MILHDDDFQLGKSLDCDHVAVVCTSEATRFICERKLGMDLMKTTNWSNYKDHDGNDYFPKDVKSTKITSYALRL